MNSHSDPTTTPYYSTTTSQTKKLHKTINENKLYTSETLNELWQHKGFATLGDVTFESAAYVARYCMKKITGDKALDHYTTYDRATGEILKERKPEYTTMSRRPGIGKRWLDKFMDDVFPDDFVVLNGKKLRPPKYYGTQYEIVEPNKFEKIKARRMRASKNNEDNSWMRLRVREEIQNYKLKQLPRNHE